MNALVVYESFYGNTEKIAQSIRGALGASGQVEAKRVSEVRPEQLRGLRLLVVGAPTRAFRPSPGMAAWLNGLGPRALDGIRVAAFDTRADIGQQSGFLALMMKIFGF